MGADNKQFFTFDELPKGVQAAFYDNYNEEDIKADVQKTLDKDGAKLESFEFDHFDEANPKKEDGYEIYVHFKAVVDGNEQDVVVSIPVSIDATKVGIPRVENMNAKTKGERESVEDFKKRIATYTFEELGGMVPVYRAWRTCTFGEEKYKALMEELKRKEATAIDSKVKAETTEQVDQAKYKKEHPKLKEGDTIVLLENIGFAFEVMRDTEPPFGFYVDWDGPADVHIDDDGKIFILHEDKSGTPVWQPAEKQYNASINANYPSYKDNEGDTIYKLPFDFKNLDELMELAKQNPELLEFLRNTGSKEGVEGKNGERWAGADIIDYLRHIESKIIGVDYEALEPEEKAAYDSMLSQLTSLRDRAEKLFYQLEDLDEQKRNADQGEEQAIFTEIDRVRNERENVRREIHQIENEMRNAFGGAIKASTYKLTLDVADPFMELEEPAHQEFLDKIKKAGGSVEWNKGRTKVTYSAPSKEVLKKLLKLAEFDKEDINELIGDAKVIASEYTEFEDLPENIQLAFWKEFNDNEDFWKNVKDATDGDVLDEDDVEETLTFDPETVNNESVEKGNYDITFDFIVNGDKASYFVSCIMNLDANGKYVSSSVSLLNKQEWTGKAKE